MITEPEDQSNPSVEVVVPTGMHISPVKFAPIWGPRRESPPSKVVDFVWIICGPCIELAYWNGLEMWDSHYPGDREGLHTERISDWSHWMWVSDTKPELPK